LLSALSKPMHSLIYVTMYCYRPLGARTAE
jgi:hypothetical protein